MVLTLEHPIRPHAAAHLVPLAATLSAAVSDPLHAYEARFGAVPAWFDEIPRGDARGLARRALARGVPLAAADYLS